MGNSNDARRLSEGALITSSTPDDGAIARFRAALVKGRKKEKTINNVLAVLSKALHYAKRVRLIEFVPEIGFFKVERPEVQFWEFALVRSRRCVGRASTSSPLPSLSSNRVASRSSALRKAVPGASFR